MKAELTPPHLGGHLNKTHLDESVFQLVQKYNIRNVLDIGCGPGGMLEIAKKHGVDWVGLDGDPACHVKNKQVILHDFTKGSYFGDSPIFKYVDYDLAWSTEFVEHVEEKYVDNFLDAFKKCRYIVMTHALPGDIGGHHHVNLQPPDYWIKRIEGIGFRFDGEETSRIRAVSNMTKDFMRKTGLFFERINDKRAGDPAD